MTCVLLGRGASTEKVEQWLEAAATVDGFIGFAIGRSIWWDALKAFLADELDRDAAATQIAENYLHFVQRLRAPAGRLTGIGQRGERDLAPPPPGTW